ncbi:MAG: hypothetical protein ACJA1Z_000408 [Patiriisocius sp.]|jgi:hypothetical protein
MTIHPAIIIVGHNRPHSLKRILYSLSKANYEGYKNIPLVISIDGGGKYNNEVLDIANSFNWPFGKKQIIGHPINLGLRKHVLFCGNLIEEYKNIVLLEEDCFVSRNFYDFASKSVAYYQFEEKVAGISLYAYSCFESFGVPFSPVHDGNDTYFVQVPSSLGQVWTKKQWNGFMDYYKLTPQINSTDKLPAKVKTWPESSWKKYFYKYMIDFDLYFVYPQISYSTNFGDVGTHFAASTQLYQVSLENTYNRKVYSFIAFEFSNNKYDAFFEILPTSLIKLGVDIDKDTCIDLMGAKDLKLYNHKYALSIKNSRGKLFGYGNALNPPILNVLFNQKADFFVYDLKSNFDKVSVEKKYELIKNSQVLSFNAGIRSILTSKYYKIGYYMLHPQEALKMFKRRLS